MDLKTYDQLFETILNDPLPASPYNKPAYMNYVKLNASRLQRWMKHGVLNTDLINAVKNISEPQTWTIITEPWCGDAAHLTPFIQRVADMNPLITVDYQLRDTPPFLIEQYLTNGTRSIPKLIIADSDKNDLSVWGPRPAQCQLLFKQLTKDQVNHDEKEILIQKWYNEDKGVSVQLELLAILQDIAARRPKVA